MISIGAVIYADKMYTMCANNLSIQSPNSNLDLSYF